MKKLFTAVLFFLGSCIILSAQVAVGGLTVNPRLAQKSDRLANKAERTKLIHMPTGKKVRLCPDDIHPASLRLEANAQKKLEHFHLVNRGNCIEIQAPEKAGAEDIYMKSLFSDGRLVEIVRHVVAIEATQLPFTDEFSYADDLVVYPDENRWLDKDAYVNDHLAYHPPSIGVATLDGTDENGRAYGQAGASDTLTSIFIDLSSYGPDDEVYFSFTYQPGGLSLAPFPQDSLILEFKNADQEWKQVFQALGPENVTVPAPEFSYEELAMSDERYLHDNFQFRFRNYSPGSGVLSVWHLDYIRIEEDFEPSPQFRLITEDVALGHPPYSIFKQYTAMPMTQFLADIDLSLRDTIRVDLYNHNEGAQTIEANKWHVLNLSNGDTLAPSNQLVDIFQDGQDNFDPGQYAIVQASVPSEQRSVLRDNIRNKLASEEEAVLEVHFDLNRGIESPRQGYQENNKASTIQYLSDFFAYDDGSAELQLGVSGDFGAVALEFELLEPQIIKGMLLSFVVVAEDDSGETFRYELRRGSLDGDVLVLEDNATVEYPGEDVNFPQFSYYEFPEIEDGIELQRGKYFLIVRSKRGVTINIGYDRQMDQINSRHYAFNTSRRAWELAGENQYYPPGVMMGRLVTSDFMRTNNQEAAEDDLSWTIYPNPARDLLLIDGLEQAVDYRVYDSFGRLRKSGTQLNKSLDVKDLTPGSYMLRLQIGRDWQQRKFLILGQ